MKISTKGRYGLRILLDLAVHDDGAPRLIRDWDMRGIPLPPSLPNIFL